MQVFGLLSFGEGCLQAAVKCTWMTPRLRIMINRITRYAKCKTFTVNTHILWLQFSRCLQVLFGDHVVKCVIFAEAKSDT